MLMIMVVDEVQYVVAMSFISFAVYIWSCV